MTPGSGILMKMGYITATPSLSRTLTRSYVGRSAGLCCLRIYYDLYPIHTSCLRRSGGVLGSREDQDGIMPGQGEVDPYFVSIEISHKNNNKLSSKSHKSSKTARDGIYESPGEENFYIL